MGKITDAVFRGDHSGGKDTFDILFSQTILRENFRNCCFDCIFQSHNVLFAYTDTYFFGCDSFSGANFESEDGKHAFGISLNSVLFGKPLDLFVISLHEMRHIFQDAFMNVEDNRTALNYSNGNFDNLGWYSSGAEIDADEFSYSTILSFVKEFRLISSIFF